MASRRRSRLLVRWVRMAARNNHRAEVHHQTGKMLVARGTGDFHVEQDRRMT